MTNPFNEFDDAEELLNLDAESLEFDVTPEEQPPEEERRGGSEEHFQAPAEGNFADSIPEATDTRVRKVVSEEINWHGVRTGGYHQDVERWWERYEGIPPPRLQELKRRAANNVQPGLTAETIDSMHARLLRPFAQVGNEVFDVKPNSAHGANVSTKIRDYLSYWTGHANLHEKLDEGFLQMLVEGQGIFKLTWVREVDSPRSGPRIDVIPTRDFVISPIEISSVDEATLVGHRFRLTWADLKEYETLGEYSNIEKVRDSYQSASYRQDGRSARANIQEATETGGSEETQPVDLYELYLKIDLDGDGLREPYLIVYSLEADVILRIQRFPYVKKTPNYAVVRCLPRVNYFYGRSIAGIVEPLQEALNAIMNRTLDALALSTNPAIKARTGSRIDWRERGGIEPGSIYYLTDPATDMVEFRLPGPPPEAFKMLDVIQLYKERVTRVTDLSHGINQQAIHTATQFSGLLDQGQQTFDVLIDRVKLTGISRIGWWLLWLLYEFRPALDEYFDPNGVQSIVRKTDIYPEGNQGIMPDNLVMSHLTIIPAGIESEASKNAQRSVMLTFAQLIHSDPLFQQIVSRPDLVYNLLEDITKVIGFKDPDRLIGTPEQHQVWVVLLQLIQQNPQILQVLMQLVQQTQQPQSGQEQGQQPQQGSPPEQGQPQG